MKGRSQQIVLRGTSAREKAVEDRMDIRALALIALTACTLSLAGTARAGEAEAVAVAVTSATGVTTTSTMIAEYAALESAYAAPAPSPVAETSLFDAFPRELTEIDLARLSGSNDLNGRVAEKLPASGTILDVGCGTGDLFLALEDREAPLIGVDSSGQMLRLARQRFARRPSIDWRLGEVEHLPLRDGEADAAVMSVRSTAHRAAHA